MAVAQRTSVPAEVAHLWVCARAAREAAGDPSPKEIDRRAARLGLRLPSSTVRDWFDTCSVVPVWVRFHALVRALGAEREQDWRALHGAAQRAKAHSRRETRAVPGPAAHSAVPQPVPPGSGFRAVRLPGIRRRAPVLFAACGLIALVGFGWPALGPGGDGKRDSGTHGGGGHGGGAAVACDRYKVAPRDLLLRDRHGGTLTELPHDLRLTVRSRDNPPGLPYWYVTSDGRGPRSGWVDYRYLEPACD